MYYFPRYFTSKALRSYLFVVVIVIFVFRNLLPFYWLTLSLLTVVLFFTKFKLFTVKWSKFSEAVWIKKVFWLSFGIRLVWVFFSYGMYWYMTGQPFEFEAADAVGYHGEALWIVGMFKAGDYHSYFEYIGSNYSDMGYPLYLGVQYLFTNKSILIARIIKVVLSAFTVVLIYRITARNFGRETGRIAGIMAMLVPNLIYYCGLHLKETEMVFLVTAFTNQADILLHKPKISLKNIIFTVLFGSSLFFFRTVLGAVAFMALFTALLFSSRKIMKTSKRIRRFVNVLLLFSLILGNAIIVEVSGYWEARSVNQEASMQYRSEREGGNKLAEYGSTAVFAPMMLVAPFPTLVDIESQQNQMLLSGAYFTRNVYAFFIIIALFYLLKKKKYKEHLLLLAFLFGYLIVLSMSAFALSERFHMPIVPFLIILASLGINNLKAKHKNYYFVYLVLISALIIGWNWFKLAGRGLV